MTLPRGVRHTFKVGLHTLSVLALAAMGLAVSPSVALAATCNATDVGEFVGAFNATAGGSVVLCGGITVGSGDTPLKVADGQSIALDLNGHSLTVAGADGLAGLGVPVGTQLTIVDTAGGGSLTATGGYGGAGIGGGFDEGAGTITVSGAVVTATGGASEGGAGIGGGKDGAGGTVTIAAGTVTAIGGDDSASIGSGDNGAGGSVVIGTDSGDPAIVTAVFGSENAFALGGERGFGDVTIKPTGTVTLQSPLIIPSGAVMTNDGTLAVGHVTPVGGPPATGTPTVSNHGTISGSGTLSGTGTVDNHGAITHTVTVDSTGGLTVRDHHYALTFDPSGGSVDWGILPSFSAVYGPDLASVGRSAAALPSATRTGFTFTGWFANADGTGSPVTADTALSGSSADGAPVPVTFYAGWASASVDRYVAVDGSNVPANDCLDPDNPCATIRYALGRVFDATPFNPAETIHVGPGTYTEAVSVNVSSTTDLTIVGAGADGSGATVITAPASPSVPALRLARAKSITIHDLAVSATAAEDGIVIEAGLDGPVRLVGVVVSDHDQDGIDIKPRTDPLTVTIDGSVFDGNGDRGIEIGAGPITLTVTDSVISNNEDGIALLTNSGNAHVTVSDSAIRGNSDYGIEAGGGNVAVVGSTITGNGVGADVYNDGRLTVTDSTIEDNLEVEALAEDNGRITLDSTDLPGGHGLTAYIEAAAALSITGTVEMAGSIDGDGTLGGTGVLVNHGAIVRTVAVDITGGLTVQDHHYALTFDPNGGSIDWGALSPFSIVHGPDLASVGRAAAELPSATRAGFTFTGWFDNRAGAGSPMADGTVFAGSSSDGTPTPVTLYAGWAADSGPEPPAGPPASSEPPSDSPSAPPSDPAPNSPAQPGTPPNGPNTGAPDIPPAPSPDGGTLMIGGQPVTPTITHDAAGVTVTFGGITISTGAVDANGNLIPGSGQALPIQAGGVLTISTDGFGAGTDAFAWIFSDPIFLGRFPVGAGGSGILEVPLPTTLPPGSHTLVITGTTADGLEVTARIPAFAADPDAAPVESETLAATGVSSDLAPIGLMAIALIVLGSALLWHRPRRSHSYNRRHDCCDNGEGPAHSAWPDDGLRGT